VTYDSTQDTKAHIARVRQLLMEVINDIGRRYWAHDRSKLEEPEKSIFDIWSPKLRAMEYSTEPESEYQKALKEMGVGLQHHYEACDHHPEHGDGTLGWMALPQLMELLADWKAAGERHAGGGDLRASIEQNAERFGYGDEIKGLLINTATYFGWL
jgi:hypothetical protein